MVGAGGRTHPLGGALSCRLLATRRRRRPAPPPLGVRNGAGRPMKTPPSPLNIRPLQSENYNEGVLGPRQAGSLGELPRAAG